MWSVPPLRERKEDIAALAAHFVVRSLERLNRSGLRLAEEDIGLLQRYEWPGNIRQFQTRNRAGRDSREGAALAARFGVHVCRLQCFF